MGASNIIIIIIIIISPKNEREKSAEWVDLSMRMELVKEMFSKSPYPTPAHAAHCTAAIGSDFVGGGGGVPGVGVPGAPAWCPEFRAPLLCPRAVVVAPSAMCVRGGEDDAAGGHSLVQLVPCGIGTQQSTHRRP